MSSASETPIPPRRLPRGRWSWTGSRAPGTASAPACCLSSVSLDEWGYPIVHSAHVDPDLGDAAIRLCPARALAWHRQPR